MIDDVIFDKAIKERINYRFEPKSCETCTNFPLDTRKCRLIHFFAMPVAGDKSICDYYKSKISTGEK